MGMAEAIEGQTADAAEKARLGVANVAEEGEREITCLMCAGRFPTPGGARAGSQAKEAQS